MICLHTPSGEASGENFLLSAGGVICLVDRQGDSTLGFANLASFSGQDLLKVSIELSPDDQRQLRLSLGGHSLVAQRLRFSRTHSLAEIIADDVNIACLWANGWAWTEAAGDLDEAVTKAGSLGISAESCLPLSVNPRLRPSALAESVAC